MRKQAARVKEMCDMPKKGQSLNLTLGSKLKTYCHF